ncbi:MAG: hypothetical protein QM757_15970 [Paludibaculum sp.]
MRGYALEARSYALLVGLFAMAAAFWQRIEEKRAFVALFGLCLSIAVACHHLAVVAVGIFGMAWKSSGLRCTAGCAGGSWAGCTVAVIPFLIGLPIRPSPNPLRSALLVPGQLVHLFSTYKLYLREDINLASDRTLAFLAAAFGFAAWDDAPAPGAAAGTILPHAGIGSNGWIPAIPRHAGL